VRRYAKEAREDASNLGAERIIWPGLHETLDRALSDLIRALEQTDLGDRAVVM
jgi:hypothetical protein